MEQEPTLNDAEDSFTQKVNLAKAEGKLRDFIGDRLDHELERQNMGGSSSFDLVQAIDDYTKSVGTAKKITQIAESEQIEIEGLKRLCRLLSQEGQEVLTRIEKELSDLKKDQTSGRWHSAELEENPQAVIQKINDEIKFLTSVAS